MLIAANGSSNESRIAIPIYSKPFSYIPFRRFKCAFSFYANRILDRGYFYCTAGISVALLAQIDLDYN